MLSASDLQRHVGRYYGKYSGEVTQNEDADQVGRVKVKVPGVFGADLEVWARPCLPSGHFFVPRVGAKVWVEFEAGDTQYPIWVGTWYPVGTAPEPAAKTPPDARVIHTPSGHTIELHDEADEEKIVIKHKSNAFVSIDKNGSVIISDKKGSHLHLNAEGDDATLMEQHGNLITMNADGTLMVNKDGTTVELKGDTARIIAKNILLQGTTVQAGAGAMEPTILGQTFAIGWNMFIAHTHATAVGPSGPPIPLPPPLAPGQGLTSSLVVK